MNEIEKRAKEYAKNQLWGIALEDDEYEQRYNSIVELYLEIATEQKAIDIDKACEIYEKELRQMKRILNEVKNGAGEIISIGGSLIQFRKAMEEELP